MSVEYVTEMREYAEQLMGSFFTLCTLFLSLPPSLPPPAFSLFQCEKSHITYLLTYLLITSKQMGQAGVSLKRAAVVVTPLASFVKVLLKCYSIKIVTKS